MKYGIIGAMDEEIQVLKASIEQAKVHQIKGFEFIEGKLGGHDVCLVKSGIGKVNATISTLLLIEHFQVDALLNTGTAGSLDHGLKIGDVVISHSVAHHDVDVTAFGYQPGQMAGMPTVYYPDSQLVRLAQQACRSLDVEPCVGLIVSGDAFISDQVKLQDIKAVFPNARACEMEAAAIAQTAYVMQVPFVIIRAISDGADEAAALSFDEFVKVAGQASARMIIRLLELSEMTK
ncbi:5'-methylthioadenosine/adenosylhomocysteine nucleosidase [Vaginisenegalia massiliensis]|uniref:5'-methylthioadenosine/adenosylhomocysteine nucleosidase n=1 Tax=Vaginisenegalia massiliensis TaxID=2058294 RepID=UPI000F548BA7|nr:5'-methylthioadenosine/adenosylhomocysteine nucleosidase [Vaginisenegalia massiliensis]